MSKMKIENIVIDSKIDLFNSRIVAVVGTAGTGKTQFLQHLYNFYNGLRFSVLYENKETLQCFSNERKHSEFEFSNKKVAIFDGFYNRENKSFMNMVRNKAHQNDVHKIFISAHTYRGIREIQEENETRHRRFVEADNIAGGNELLYSADIVLKIEKSEDGLYKLHVTKYRSNHQYETNLVPFFSSLAEEYSKRPLYPNRFLRQHLLKYSKFDLSIYPMDNFKDIFNI